MKTHFSELKSEVAADFRCRLLNLKPIGQRCELWCWAASTEMIVRFLRGDEDTRDDIEQGRQMNRRLGAAGVDCTSIETAREYEICNGKGGWPYFFVHAPRRGALPALRRLFPTTGWNRSTTRTSTGPGAG